MNRTFFKKTIFLCLFNMAIIFSANCFGEESQLNSDSNIQTQLSELSARLEKIQANFKNTTENQLMLGTEQAEIIKLNHVLDNVLHSTEALKTYQNLNKNINLKWQKSETLKPIFSENNLFNANSNAQNPIYICRAEFLGAALSNKGFYPGILTEKGCHISYAGYAFTVSHFDFLVGNMESLQWIPIEKIKSFWTIALQDLKRKASLDRVQSGSICDGNTMNYRIWMPDTDYPLYNLKPRNNTPIPIAGGFEGGKPVYICRAPYQNKLYIGKLVTFIDANGRLEDACDIPVEDNEIVIKNNYDLLATKFNE